MKRRIPPILVTCLRLAILSLLIWINPDIITHGTVYNALFWLSMGSTFVFYLRTSVADPGFQIKCPSTLLGNIAAQRALDIGLRLLEHNPSLSEDSPSSDANIVDLAVVSTSSYHDIYSGAIVIDVNHPAEPDRKWRLKRERYKKVLHNIFWIFRNPDKAGTAVVQSLYSMILIWAKKTGRSCGLIFLPWRDLLIFLYDFKRAPHRATTEDPPTLYEPGDSGKPLFRLGASALYQSGEKLQFCSVCQIWKPLRAKHCRSCQKCVRLYDHHCPWLGVCVAERNRPHFLWYLGLESLSLVWVIYEAFNSVFGDLTWIEEKVSDHAVLIPRIAMLVSCISLSGLAMLTVSLLSFHAFLMFHNITTWEFMSWHRIPYLRHKTKDKGSPFSGKDYQENCIYGCLPVSQRRLFHGERAVLGPQGDILWSIGDSSAARMVPGCMYHSCI